MAIPGDPYWDSVTLLLHLDATVGTGITLDVSPIPKTVTPIGAATISSTQSKFGGASSFSSTSGNYFQIENGMGGGLDNSVFTIEFFAWVAPGTASTGTFFDVNNSAQVYGGIHFTPAGIYASTTGVSWNIGPTGGLNTADGQWHYYALTRDASGVLTLWVDSVNRAQYSIGTAASFTVGSGGSNGRIAVGSYGNSASCYVDEVRVTRGVTRDVSVVPTAPFPDVDFLMVSRYTVEAVAESDLRLPMQLRTRSASKQVMLQATPTVARYQLEAVARDTSFVMPRDTRSRSNAKTVLLAVTPRVYGYQLEAVASAEAVLPGDLRSRANMKQVLLSSTPQVSKYQLEAVAEDAGFVIPGDTRMRSASKQVLVAPPKEINNSNYQLEAVGYGTTPTPSSLFTLEAVVGLPYNTPISNFTLEAIAESTITPPRPQTVIVWFTVVDP